MIYYIVRDLDDPGFDEKILEVVGVVLNEKEYTTNDFIGNTELFNLVAGASQPVKLVWLPSMANPRLTFPDDVQNPSQYSRVDDVYNLIEKRFNADNGEISKEDLSKIIAMVGQRYPDDAKTRVAICYAHLLYLNAQECTNVINVGASDMAQGDFFVATTNKLQEHNNKFAGAFRSISDDENVTLFQAKPSNKLFLKIPSRNEVIATESEEMAVLIPDGKAVCIPYDDKNAYISQYREKVPKYLIPLIEGDASNNNLEIQENEQSYYNALMEWIGYNVKQEFDNVSDEEVANGTCMIDELSQEYMEELIDHIYSWHWSHNPNIPVSFSYDADSTDSETGEVSESRSYGSRYALRYDATLKTQYNAIIILNEFLQGLSAKLGFRVYPEAAVKLARWGERKPTALTLDGSEKMFDLATNSVKQNIGSISEYQVHLIDGHQYSLACFITVGNKIADAEIDTNEIKNPIGLIASSKYVRESDGNELLVPTYFSLFDVLPAIKDGSLDVYGITWDGSKFNVDRNYDVITIEELVAMYESATDRYLRNPFSCGTDLKDLCIEFGGVGGDARQNVMSMVSEAVHYADLNSKLQKYKLHSVSELQGMIMSGVAYSPMAVLVTNVARVTLPILLKIDKECDWRVDVRAWLGMWQHELESWGGIKSFYEKVGTAPEMASMPESAQDEAPVSASGQVAMTAFGSSESKEQTGQAVAQASVPAGIDIGALIQEIPSGTVKAIYNEDQSAIIGGYVRIHVKVEGGAFARFVVFDYNTWDALREKDGGDNAGKGVKIHKLLPFFANDLACLAIGHPERLRLVFNSVESIYHFTEYFREWSKKLETA